MENAISFRNLQLRYKSATTPALSIDHLDISQGQMLGIIGPSGSGKSTLLRAIIGSIKPTSGTVQIANTDIRNNNKFCNVSMIYQNFNLIPRMNVLTNVLMGRLAWKSGFLHMFPVFNEKDKYLALAALDRVGMLSFSRADVRDLSGGQMQRVAIARCLAQDTKIILADEPVAALDPINARNVIELLVSLNQERNITILVNLHQLDLVEKYCSSVLGLSGGRLSFYHAENLPEQHRSEWQKLYG